MTIAIGTAARETENARLSLERTTCDWISKHIRMGLVGAAMATDIRQMTLF